MKEYAFVGSRPYPSEALETILKDCLGTETVMADIEHPKLMVLAILADRKPVDLHIFRNYQSGGGGRGLLLGGEAGLSAGPRRAARVAGRPGQRSHRAGCNPVTMLKDIDVFKPESLIDAARLALGIRTRG
ncbi:unnamed protein product [Leptidea sinapis]|uniref:Uncharacterized protein n=1 Tax=Leptidea sinapis TaxID=189913 RepID=A0A5E4QRH3_9NEOP|nr:unnamed protein product [Leptidea sinapis]